MCQHVCVTEVDDRRKGNQITYDMNRASACTKYLGAITLNIIHAPFPNIFFYDS